MRIDDGEWRELKQSNEKTWSAPLDGGTLPKGEHTLEVRVVDGDGAEGRDSLTFLSDLSGRFNPYPMVQPIVTETKFC